MARMHGSHGKVEVDTVGGSPYSYSEVASLNKWTLNMARDQVDVTCFGDANKTYVLGLPDIKGTLGGFLDPGAGSPIGGNLTIFDVAAGDVACTLRLSPSTLEPTLFWWGLAYLDAAIDVSATGAITITGNFAAAGPWLREP